MARVVRKDADEEGRLYAGTDTSVYISWDKTTTLRSRFLNLPTTPITDLQVHRTDP